MAKFSWGPTAAEQQQIALQNQLMQAQLGDIATKRAEEAAKTSPAALNAASLARRNTQTKDFNTARSAGKTAAVDRVSGQLRDAGMESMIPQYVQQIIGDYGNLQYRNGSDLVDTSTTTGGYEAITPENFDSDRYLKYNPDVASGLASGSAVGTPWEHYQKFGQAEGRKYGTAPVVNASSTGGTADSWDDPGTLADKDYVGTIINDARMGRKNSAYGTATNTVQQRLGGMGLDKPTMDTLLGSANSLLKNTYDTSGLSANDYSNVFDPNATLDSVLGTERNARRASYSTAARSAFAGVDPNKDFADTADDSYISDIVGTQYNDAKSALDRAKARGALTDTGYSSGMGLLGTNKAAADSTAQTLGGAVLNRYRTDMSGVKSNALTKAGAYDFGDSFDPNSFLTDYTNKKSSNTAALGGDIASALQGQNFFNIGDVLTKAGYAQGAQNTASLTDGFGTPAAAAIDAQRNKVKDASRGLGGAGTF